VVHNLVHEKLKADKKVRDQKSSGEPGQKTSKELAKVNQRKGGKKAKV